MVGVKMMSAAGLPWGLRAGVTLCSLDVLQADFTVGVT